MDAIASHAVDCLVVGGGPAGLTAATYLARYRREVVVVDGGASRAGRIARPDDTPGFPDGTAGPQLLERIRLQADAAGVVVTRGDVSALVRDGGGFLAATSCGDVRARSVLLATGIERRPHNSLALALGAKQVADGRLEVDLRQQTSVPGLYAAGDAVESLGQVAVAFAEGAVAATAIHRSLPANFR